MVLKWPKKAKKGIRKVHNYHKTKKRSKFYLKKPANNGYKYKAKLMQKSPPCTMG